MILILFRDFRSYSERKDDFLLNLYSDRWSATGNRQVCHTISPKAVLYATYLPTYHKIPLNNEIRRLPKIGAISSKLLRIRDAIIRIRYSIERLDMYHYLAMNLTSLLLLFFFVNV